MPNVYDVAIIGGGPAGSAAAIALAQRGAKVALVEKTEYAQPRIGETLLPAARVPLAKLGVWERFLHDKPLPSPANISVWGENELEESHFIFNPYGSGWHIDRARFDGMLACAAIDAGAHVLLGTRLSDWSFERDLWRVAVAGSMDICARFLIDATGRAAHLSRRMGSRRQTTDRLIGMVLMCNEIGAVSAQTDNRTLVESAEQGWWYSAFLPTGHAILAFMTDRDLAPSSRGAAAEFWQRQFDESKFTRERIGLGSFENPNITIFSASSYIADPIVGNNWLAIGDAAFAFDPLSSQGIYNSLQSGILAGECIAKHFAETTDAFCEYVGWAQARYQKFLLKRNWYYNQERRWSHAEFWKRRQRDGFDDRQ